MTARSNRAEYDKRMHRVIGHIDRHLHESLNLEQLAEVAHFSAFHFHRVFTVWMGETLGEYLRRRRLETAAMRLIAQPRVPVLEIALAVGFGSAEAFARAFRGQFGVSPTQWRSAQSKPDQVHSKLDQASAPAPKEHDGSSHAFAESVMQVRLQDREPVSVAYLRHTGPFGEPLLRFWGETVLPWMVTHDLLGRDRYGISLDDPGITAPEQLRYDACVEVPQDFEPVGDAFKTTIPGGRYAALDFKGTVAEVGDAWLGLVRDWLPQSGFQLDARPLFEYYPADAGYDSNTGVFSCKICIPVAPL